MVASGANDAMPMTVTAQAMLAAQERVTRENDALRAENNDLRNTVAALRMLVEVQDGRLQRVGAGMRHAHEEAAGMVETVEATIAEQHERTQQMLADVPVMPTRQPVCAPREVA